MQYSPEHVIWCFRACLPEIARHCLSVSVHLYRVSPSTHIITAQLPQRMALLDDYPRCKGAVTPVRTLLVRSCTRRTESSTLHYLLAPTRCWLASCCVLRPLGSRCIPSVKHLANRSIRKPRMRAAASRSLAYMPAPRPSWLPTLSVLASNDFCAVQPLWGSFAKPSELRVASRQLARM